MNTQAPIYRFASLRNPNSEYSSDDVEYVEIATDLISDLTDIVESDIPKNEKLEQYNTVLQDYIDSDFFVKSKKPFKDVSAYAEVEPLDILGILYNNIVVRTLTKSTNNEIFKLLVEFFKKEYRKGKPEIKEIEITLPESITPSFLGYIGENPEPEPEDETKKKELLQRLNELAEAEILLIDARNNAIISFATIGHVNRMNVEYQNILSFVGQDRIGLNDAKVAVEEAISAQEKEQRRTKTFNRELNINEKSTIADELKNSPEVTIRMMSFLNTAKNLIGKLEEQGVTVIEKVSTVSTEKYNFIFNVLDKANFTLEEAFLSIENETKKITNQLKTLIKEDKYVLFGTNWINVTDFQHGYKPNNKGNHLITEENGCDLKFPYQIADLRVVETETVGYLPDEIAHINNTQKGEKQIRETRRLNRIETTESFLTDDEIFRETDSQSTEKFSIENVSSQIQSKANEVSVYASASASFGPVSTSVDAGFSNSSSTVNSSIVAQKEAKETFQSVVDRVSKRVKTERSTTTIEEFEEKVIHEIDNSNDLTKSYVYRWLSKLVRGTLKNYGKRLIYEIDVVHPAHFYLSRAIQDSSSVLSVPKDPRKVSIDGLPVLTIDNITRDNYHIWAIVYKIDIEQPPKEKIIISDSINGAETTSATKMINIPDDYYCRNGWATSYYYDYQVGGSMLLCTVGLSSYGGWANGGQYFWTRQDLWFNHETKQIPVSVYAQLKGFYVNVEIECHLEEDAYKAWKIKTYNAIVSAYEDLLNKANEEQASFNPNNPGINPSKKMQLIKDELKRETIRKMFRCNPFWLKDNFVVGQEYNSRCCSDAQNALKVKFIETTFDWANITYQFHPYFYSDKNNWNELLNLSDDDPHFEAFMQASYATVRIPVFRDELKERAAINFLQFNTIANYDVVPEGFDPLLTELKDNQPSKFYYDIDGNELPEPVEIIDLGIFKVPTDLVMLECGNSDGVKPIGFPQTALPTTDVSIPKQYSPAIIADTCDTSPLPPIE